MSRVARGDGRVMSEGDARDHGVAQLHRPAPFLPICHQVCRVPCGDNIKRNDPFADVFDQDRVKLLQ